MSIWNSGELDQGTIVAYRYGWSNAHPAADDPPAEVGLACIPPFCVPGHQRVDEDSDAWGEWLRLGVDDGERWTAAVMDDAAVRQLHGLLGEWLDRPKLTPTSSTAREDQP